jgi:hypothetical protein
MCLRVSFSLKSKKIRNKLHVLNEMSVFLKFPSACVRTSEFRTDRHKKK